MTTTLPLMKGCISQWYAFFPTVLKVCEYLCPDLKCPELNEPALFAVTVCGALSLLIHLTLVPRFMVIWPGLKRKFWITTVLVGCWLDAAMGCLCALTARCLCAPVAETTNGVLTRSSAATVVNKTMRLISVTSSYFSRPTAKIRT